MKFLVEIPEFGNDDEDYPLNSQSVEGLLSNYFMDVQATEVEE